MRRTRTLFALFVVAVTLVAIRPALADGSSATQLWQLLNSSRASSGLAPLSVSSELTAIAQQRAADMASQGRIFHQSLAGIDGQRVGENVGVASTVDTVHQLFLESASHRANIFGDYTEVGIGVVWADGEAYVNELYRLPWGTSAAPAAAVEPAVVEPAPAPTPAVESPAVAAEPEPEPAVAEPAPEPAPTTTTTVVERTTPPTFGARVLPIAHASAVAADLPSRPAPEPAALVPALTAVLLLGGLFVAHARVLVRARVLRAR